MARKDELGPLITFQTVRVAARYNKVHIYIPQLRKFACTNRWWPSAIWVQELKPTCKNCRAALERIANEIDGLTWSPNC